MFNLKVVERPYPDIYKMYSALGPNVAKPGGVGAKGVSWSCAPEYEQLKARLGVVSEPGVSEGMPRIDNAKDACEIMLALSPESNGDVGVRSWAGLEKQTGFKLNDSSRPVQDQHLTFEGITARPTKGFTSPNWSGIEVHGRTYAPFELNVQRLVPFHTLTGRQHFYMDHEWMRGLGEALPVYRPPLSLAAIGEISGPRIPRTDKDLVLNFLSPHSKWSIHSSYSDNHIMRELSRGGGEIWLNNDDAASAGIADNDWLECFERERRVHGPRGGEPSYPAWQDIHPSCAGAYRQRAAFAAFRNARRHAQQPHPASRQADPDDRRVRAAFLFLQLLRSDRLSARRVRRRAEGAGGCEVLKIGEGRGNPSEEGLPSPLPKPHPSPS